MIKGKNTALSSRASTICYYIKGLCATTNRQYQDAFTFFGKSKEIFDRHPHIRADLAKRYLKTLSNLLYCYIDSKNYEAAFSLIKDMIELRNKPGFDTLEMEVKIFTSTHIAELMLHNKMGDFDKAVRVSKDIAVGMEKYKGRINKEQQLVFSYHISYAYFGTEQFKDALFWINQVLNDTEQTLRQDIFGFSRLFNLLIHFELGNHDLMEYTIKSTSRYLNKKEKDYQIEGEMIRYLKKLIKVTIEFDRKEIYEKMMGEFEKMLENPVERIILEYVDVLSWLESKISKRSFAESVKKRNLTVA